MLKSLFLFFLAAGLYGQTFEYGLKGGVPITNAFQTFTGPIGSVFTDSKGFVLGPMVGLWLPFGLGVEVDALYRPLNYSTQPTGAAASNNTIANWEVPVLAKYRLGFPLVKPYIEAGPSFRHVSNAGPNLSNTGFALGAGVEVGLLKFHVSPELRYTHWGSDGLSQPFPNLHSGQNQAEFLIGVTF